MKHLAGKFIVFDGGEGCGKSTQIARLADAATKSGVKVLSVRDPGTTRIGELIRSILLNPDHTEMAMRCEMLLYMSARAQMIAEVIRPALDRGELVICDRFVSSTLAYQLGGDGLTASEIRQAADVALRGQWPDRILILDMPPEISQARVQSKFVVGSSLFGEKVESRVKDRIERRPFAYHVSVRERFLDQAREHPDRYRVIDASKSVDDVHTAVLEAIVDVT